MQDRSALIDDVRRHTRSLPPNSLPSMTSRERLSVHENGVSLVIVAAFAVAYGALTFAATPHTIDTFPDSHTYLPVSFLGHAERLWAIPVIYYIAGNSVGRVVVQTIIGLVSWIVLAVQFGAVLQNRMIRYSAQIWLLLLALSAPVLQWNRIILSESLSISFTVLLFAAGLRLVRRTDVGSVALFLLAAILWTFSRQVDAFITAGLAVPIFVLAWRRPHSRRLAFWTALGVILIGIWGTVTTFQTSTVSPGHLAPTNPSEAQLAGIVQFRAATDPAELNYFRAHGLPETPALKIPPPFSTVGQPVNVDQFANPYAEYRLADDPQFKRWANREGQSVYLKYLVSHPWAPLAQTTLNAPRLMTMNPDYVSTLAIPSWISTLVYGNLSSEPSPNTGSGAPRSSDPVYADVLFALGICLFLLAARRRRLNGVVWTTVVAVIFSGLWALAVWSFAATELPREFIETAVLFHIALIAVLLTSLDVIVSNGTGQSRTRPTVASLAPDVSSSRVV